MALFIETLIAGLCVGGVYVMISMGFSLCFGVMHVIDFAVGEWLMIGGFIGFVLYQLGMDPFATVPILIAIFFVVGYIFQPIIQHVIGGRRTSNPVLMGLVFTFGLALFIQGIALAIWGHDRRFIRTIFTGESLSIAEINIPYMRLLVLAIGLIAAFLLLLWLSKTKSGLRVRVTAEDREIANILGVDINRYSRLVYAIYTGMTAASGVLVGSIFAVFAEMGFQYTTFAFFTVVLAGMGYVPGVLVAGLALGILQALISVYLGGAYIYLLLFLILYLTLLIAPQGLLGKGLKAE
jgi:branched-chain amino acid transport system permease protein